MKKNLEELKTYIKNNLQGYDGYIQYLDTRIKNDDIFIDSEIKLKDKYIFEANFCNGKRSVSIKLINGEWLVNEIDDIGNDFDLVYADLEKFPYKIRMAKIWEINADELCENLKVNRLKAVVFAGFVKEKK